ncbi:hypothetical protein RUM43_000446 [Polyplax serrata]|uniref:CREG-like beta-barrel domain-containing protein n=1 Tax=Polyplax serrata TaxID=468196 RepID=A0AAN8SDZ7_POLSC
MTEPRESSEIGPTRTMEQTETSPLKQSDTKKNWFYNILYPVNDQEQGSLRIIILNFFGFTVIVTIALLVQIYYGNNANAPHGGVASDSYECSKIGIEILKKGGNSVDAAIATKMCLGVVNFHITGLGGGGYMLIYDHKNLEVLDIIDFQVTVPHYLAYSKIDTKNEGLTVGVPGFLLGLWEASQKFGKLPWKEIVAPSINLAKNGFLVNENLVYANSYLNSYSNHNHKLKELLNSLAEGRNITLPELAATLELISSNGIKEFYNGSLAMDIIYAVKQANGNMSLDDLAQYQTSHSELLQIKFGNFNVLAPGSSSGGALLLNSLERVESLDLTPEESTSNIILKISDILHDTYNAFLEKNGADPESIKSIASQVSVTDNEDLYVVIVSGLNTWLGSQLLTESGFILNSGIANGGINHEARPLSLATPVIAIQHEEICGRRLILGVNCFQGPLLKSEGYAVIRIISNILGAGDATIAAQVLTYALLFNNNISTSVETPRFFIDHVPRQIWLEDMHKPFFNSMTLEKLKAFLKMRRIVPPYESINAIDKTEDLIFLLIMLKEITAVLLILGAFTAHGFDDLKQVNDADGFNAWIEGEKQLKANVKQEENFMKENEIESDEFVDKYNKYGKSFHHEKHYKKAEKPKTLKHDIDVNFSTGSKKPKNKDIEIVGLGGRNTKEKYESNYQNQNKFFEKRNKKNFYQNLKKIDLSVPPKNNTVLLARYIVHNVDWTSLGTLSGRTPTEGNPFVCAKAMSDGPTNSSTGIPFFYLSSLDLCTQDSQKFNKVSMLVTLSQTDYCKDNDLDPQDPRCAKLTISGEMKRLKAGSEEEKFAKNALFSRHPIMENWPKGHNWYFAKLKINQLVLLDRFGGAAFIDVNEYLNPPTNEQN